MQTKAGRAFDTSESPELQSSLWDMKNGVLIFRELRCDRSLGSWPLRSLRSAIRVPQRLVPGRKQSHLQADFAYHRTVRSLGVPEHALSIRWSLIPPQNPSDLISKAHH